MKKYILRKKVTLNENEKHSSSKTIKENEEANDNSTWIYASFNVGDSFSRIYNRILFHTKKDYNNMEYINKTFPPFSGIKYIDYVDFIFNLDTLTDITDNKIWLNDLSSWYIIPESIANSLIPEMKKWNEDTIKRNKISQMFKSTFESVGRNVKGAPQRKKNI